MINRASKLEGKMEKNGRSDEWKKKSVPQTNVEGK